MESSREGWMESRAKGDEKYSLWLMPCADNRDAMQRAVRVDSIPIPSVLDKNNGSKKPLFFGGTDGS